MKLECPNVRMLLSGTGGFDEIISNIDFPKPSRKEISSFGLRDFIVSEELDYVICPNGIKTTNFSLQFIKRDQKEFKLFKFDRKECDKCPLRDQCFYKKKDGTIERKMKTLCVPMRYDAILNDKKRVETEEFKIAIRKRSKVERRFATLVRNHGLRRCRSVRLNRAKIHITMANMACNIVRMVNLLLEDDPNIAMA